tara:strand:- start:2869 stop:2988 length:120 start_codon:yes stop_codon:yes gene_type:complete
MTVLAEYLEGWRTQPTAVLCFHLLMVGYGLLFAYGLLWA